MSEAFEPRILSFLCNWCSYAGADLAGVSRFQYPPSIRVIRTMCSGRVDPAFVLEGLENGFDAVLVIGCHLGDCHYIDGNHYTVKRMKALEELLELSGIGRERMALRWVSAAEGQIFADTVKEITNTVRGLGPFDAKRHRLQLAALMRVVQGQRHRWLTGMELRVTQQPNVYGQRTDPAMYADVLRQADRDEYHKALILECMRSGPRSVRELASETGLPVYTVSLRLNDLERRGQAELKGFEGRTPRFMKLSA
jgi:coenzyme F420-reducing hydrogenase delta subunit